MLHVTFTGGESEYSIGPDVPILANALGDISVLKLGTAVFVIALKPDGTVTAARLYAEKRRDQTADVTHPRPQSSKAKRQIESPIDTEEMAPMRGSADSRRSRSRHQATQFAPHR